MLEIKYFEIDENLAFYARQQWSFTDYEKGSITKNYKQEIDSVYGLVEIIARVKPEYTAEAIKLAEKFSHKMAEWWNVKHRIDMMCPSVMICGPANFPVKKKEKQIARTQTHFNELEVIKGIKLKIENILNGNVIIKSNDENAIDKLQEKLSELVSLKEQMKLANKYYKKFGSLEGFTGLKQETINRTMELVNRGIVFGSSLFDTSNTNAKIKAMKVRIELLQIAKETGTKETFKSDICKVVENSDLMRIQLVFADIPSNQIRSILKSNGFKWSPSNKAWQRLLTENAKYTTSRVLDQLNQLHIA